MGHVTRTAVLALIGACAATASMAAAPDDYRVAFAQEVYARNAQWVHDRQPQPLLRAAVVLHIKPRPDGYEVSVVRDNRTQPEMTRRALETVKNARPLPVPPSAGLITSQGFMEVWLFDNDGTFQVRTLAREQRSESAPR